MKISQLKMNIKKIITTLNKLKKHRDNLTRSSSSLSTTTFEIDKCKEKLEMAFANLESQPLNELVTQVKKRKTKRCTKKLKVKKGKGQTISVSHCQLDPSASLSFVSEQPSGLIKCKLRSSKKYLALMEGLETLHRLKGGDDSCKLKQSLNSIKSIWQSTEYSINEELNHNSLAKSWDKVLFGGRSEIEIVPGLGEFVERRCIWDTYLDSSNGSNIPVGWVYPNFDASSEWKQFLQLT